MNSIKQIREQFDLITEKEEKEDRKLSALVRAGLYDAKKLPALKRALDKSADKITAQEKRMLINLLDSLIAQVVSDEQVYRKVRQNVHNVNEAKMDTYSKFDPRYKAGWPTDKEMPSVLILKRKAIRVYPDNQKVALYYSQALDKYVTIPYNDIQTSLNEAKKDDDKKKKILNLKVAGKRVEMRRKAIDAAHLVGKTGEYSNVIKRASALKGRGLNAGAVAGTLVNDMIKRAYIKAKLNNRKSLKTSSTTPNVSKIPAAKSVATTKRTGLSEEYHLKIQQLREDREINEIAPLVAAGLAAARVAAPYIARTAARYAPVVGRAIVSGGRTAISKGKELSKKAIDAWKKSKANKAKKRNSGSNKKDKALTAGRGGRLATTAAALGSAAGSSSSDSTEKSSMSPTYNFTAKPPTSSSFANRAQSNAAQQRRDERLARQSQQAMMKESNVIETIKSIVENNIPEQVIEFDENKITINNTVAKKMIDVYESINKTNKRKMEQMLNESATSFNKVLMFAVRQ